MGYQYLVKIERDTDRYLLVDGRNNGLLFLGSRSEFQTHEYWKQAFNAESFDFCDENGSTDQRMFWDDSTYIEFDSYAVTRDTLTEFVDNFDGNCNPEMSRKDLYIVNRDIRAFGSIYYPELYIGAKSVGVSEDELNDFIKENRIATDYGFCKLDGRALFASAKHFAAGYYEILTWAATIARAACGERRSLQNILDNRKHASGFLNNYYSALGSLQPEVALRLVTALGEDTSNVGIIMEDLVHGEEADINDVIAFIESGHTSFTAIRKLIRSGIDPQLAAGLV